MARVEAHADAWMVVHLRDDRRELLEGGAKRGSLARRLLQQHHRLAAAPRPQQLEQRLSDQCETVRGVAVGVAPWMKDDAEQAERFRTIELVTHGLHRLSPQRGIA